MKDNRSLRTAVWILWELATFWLPNPRSGRHYRANNAREYRELGAYLLGSLVSCYQRVFREPPWGEEYEYQAVLDHLQQTLTAGDGRLAVKETSERVVGFAWGGAFAHWAAILASYKQDIGEQLSDAAYDSLRDGLAHGIGEVTRPLLFVFELAALRGHRGLTTIRELILPLLLHFRQCGGMVYWTSPSAATYNEAFILGAREVWRGRLGKNEIVFFYLKDTSPLRKAFYYFPERLLSLFVHRTARVGGLGSRK